MNRKLYLIIIGIVEALFLIYTIVLYQSGTINTSDLQTACATIAVASVLCFALAYVKSSWMAIKNEDELDPDFIEVPRTREGTILEVLTGLILAGAWIVAIASDRFWVIKGFFSFLSALLLFTLTIITITVLWLVYLPGYQAKIRNYTNEKQVALDIRMWRLVAVEFALFVLTYIIPLDYMRLEYIYMIPIIIVITIVIFRYLIKKAQ